MKNIYKCFDFLKLIIGVIGINCHNLRVNQEIYILLDLFRQIIFFGVIDLQ